MQISGTVKPRRRWVGTIVIGIVVIALLVGAAFVWGNVLKADTTNSSTQSVSPAAASSYNGSLGVAAVRGADGSRASAAFSSSSLGVAAVRAVDASK